MTWIFALFLTAHAFAAAPQCGTVFMRYTSQWLEENSQQRQTWIHGQNQKANQYFQSRPSKQVLEEYFRAALSEPVSFETKSIKDGTLHLYDTGLTQPKSPSSIDLVLEKDGQSKVIFKGSDLAKNGDYNISTYQIDPKERNVILPVARKGSLDDFEVHVIDITSGTHREVIKNVFSEEFTWISANEFTYKAAQGSESKIMIHKIGTPQAEDRPADSSYEYGNSLDQKWVLRYSKTEIEFRSLDATNWYPLHIKEPKAVGALNGQLLVIENSRNGFGQLKAVQLSDPSLSGFLQRMFGGSSSGTVLIKESPMKIIDAQIKDQTIFVQRKLGAHIQISAFTADGKPLSTVELPDSASLSAYTPVNDHLVQVTLSSPVVRNKTFTYDLQKQAFIDGDPKTAMMTDSSGNRYLTTFETATSADGTPITLRMVRKEGVQFNGHTPTHIQGYGGFNVDGYFDPRYNPAVTEILRSGGLYVAPGLRGDGEFGPQHHVDGAFDKKQNVFNDFIAATEYLIKKGYTSPENISAMGFSNGGLLMGALVTQRPDLFGAVIVGAGVLDMMGKERLDPRFVAGWSYEYGRSDDPKMGPIIEKYSPVQNVKKQNYPTVLIVAGENDSRVNPAHSYKFAEALQAAQTGTSPILLTTFKNSGHFVTSGSYQDIIAWRANVRMWSTIFDATGLKPAPVN